MFDGRGPSICNHRHRFWETAFPAAGVLEGRTWEIIVNLLKLIFLPVAELGKQAWLLPQTIANNIRHRQRRTILHELEAERLDRIRNPSKYRGK